MYSYIRYCEECDGSDICDALVIILNVKILDNNNLYLNLNVIIKLTKKLRKIKVTMG
jgi:hypothetical protein